MRLMSGHVGIISGYHFGRPDPLMKRAICLGVAMLAAATVAVVRAGQENRGPEQARALLDTYCDGCHNTRIRARRIALDTLASTPFPSMRTSGKRRSASCAAG